MARWIENALWIVTFGLLIGLAVPWFLWEHATVVAGLPVWLWWHVAWMVVAAVAFGLFTRRAWGLGVAGVGRP